MDPARMDPEMEHILIYAFEYIISWVEWAEVKYATWRSPTTEFTDIEMAIISNESSSEKCSASMNLPRGNLPYLNLTHLDLP